MTVWSSRPSASARPELVVASAGNPSAASSRADPASHGFGMTKIPGPSWRARKRSAAVMRRGYAPGAGSATATAIRSSRPSIVATWASPPAPSSATLVASVSPAT